MDRRESSSSLRRLIQEVEGLELEEIQPLGEGVVEEMGKGRNLVFAGV